MTLRDVFRRHGNFIADHYRDVKDAAAYGKGQAATYISVAKAWADGVVTETTTLVSVYVAGPQQDLLEYAGADAGPPGERVQFSLPARGLSVTPAKGDRIEVGDRTWVVLAIEPQQVRGVLAAWQLHCGEVGRG